jgi:hypothetical protein
MTITENFIGGAITVISVFSYGHLSDFFKSDFLFDIHFSVVICDFLVKSSQITIVPMHVSFIIHYKNNLIDKKDSYPSFQENDSIESPVPPPEGKYVFKIYIFTGVKLMTVTVITVIPRRWT